MSAACSCSASSPGAARELTEALIVNPYDLDEASAALAAALDMSGRGAARSDARHAGAGGRVQRVPVGGTDDRRRGALEKPRSADGTADRPPCERSSAAGACDVPVLARQSGSPGDVRLVERAACVRLRRHACPAGGCARAGGHAAVHAPAAHACQPVLSRRRDFRPRAGRCAQPASGHGDMPGRGQSRCRALGRRRRPSGVACGGGCRSWRRACPDGKAS